VNVATLILANRPLRPFKLLFAGVYALRAVTTRSKCTVCPRTADHIFPAFTYRIPRLAGPPSSTWSGP